MTFFIYNLYFKKMGKIVNVTPSITDKERDIARDIDKDINNQRYKKNACLECKNSIYTCLVSCWYCWKVEYPYRDQYETENSCCDICCTCTCCLPKLISFIICCPCYVKILCNAETVN